MIFSGMIMRKRGEKALFVTFEWASTFLNRIKTLLSLLAFVCNGWIMEAALDLVNCLALETFINVLSSPRITFVHDIITPRREHTPYQTSCTLSVSSYLVTSIIDLCVRLSIISSVQKGCGLWRMVQVAMTTRWVPTVRMDLTEAVSSCVFSNWFLCQMTPPPAMCWCSAGETNTHTTLHKEHTSPLGNTL